MQNKGLFYGLMLMLIASMALAGCKAKPAERAGFADSALMVPDETLPFNSVWIKSGVDWKFFDQIYIAPVNTSYFRKQSWWQETSRASEIFEDVEKAGEFMRETFIEAFKDDPNKRFKVVKRSLPEALILELAIIELTPNKAYLKIGSWIPYVGIAVAALNSSNMSTVAFEARVRDGASGQIVAEFADREQEKLYVVSKKHFYWWAHARGIIEEWAAQFVMIANKQPDEVIKDTKTYDLNPW